MSQLLFFGASITQGVGDNEGGWVDRLKRELHHQMYGSANQGESLGVFNLGIAGNTSEMLLKRMVSETESRAPRDGSFIFVISVGTNDSKATSEPTNYVSDVETYERNLQVIIDYAKKHSDKLLLVGLPPCDDTKTLPKGGSYFSLERIRQFDASMTKVARGNGIAKVEILDTFLSQDWKKMLFEDGLHPNAAGHSFIANQVRPELWKLLGL